MKIRVMKVNGSSKTVRVSQGATVADAIEEAGFDRSNCSVQVNSSGAETIQTLQDRDTVTLTPKVKGGARFGEVLVQRLGHGEEIVELGRGDTVGDVLQRTDLTFNGCELFVNSSSVELQDSVSGGDTLTIAPQIEGGY